MRTPRSMPGVLLLAVSEVAFGQASLAPRRLSPSFTGQVPLIWTLEGDGVLKGLRSELLDERGKVAGAWSGTGFQKIGLGLWQSTALENPGLRFKDLAEGQYILSVRTVWNRGGQEHEERTEVALRLEGKGAGWLQRAFQGMDLGGAKLNLPNQWPQGGALPLKIEGSVNLKRVRYQLVSETDEQVLRPWTDLPLKGQRTWTLQGDRQWPQVAAILWVMGEDSQGRLWVDTEEVWLGMRFQGSPNPSPASTGTGVKASRASKVILPSVAAPPAAEDNASFLSAMNTDDLSLPWVSSNWVASVTAGYRDSERNGASLWPALSDRPTSLSITAANWLGKPLYGVSYLLAQGMDLEGAAGQIIWADAGGKPQFPPGAKLLSVGGVMAPVVVSAGTVEDLQGKPIAAGYGWTWTDTSAAPAGQGAMIDANTWSDPSKTTVAEPPIGVGAIKAAARFVMQRQADQKLAVGFTGSESDLDATRDPFALTISSTDPLDRPVLSKGLGASTWSGPTPYQTFPSNAPQDVLVENFDQPFRDGMILRVGGTFQVFDLVSGATNGKLQLPPPTRTGPVRDAEESDPGSILIKPGRLIPGGSAVITFNEAGPMTDMVLDASTWSAAVDGLSVTRTTVVGNPYTTVTLTITATKPIEPWISVSNAAAVGGAPSFIDDVKVTASEGTMGFQLPEATLDASSGFPGFTHTQYGVVTIAGRGIHQVTMVTDPDGSAVAELKDPEGKTVLKIVNPDTSYTSQFLDYRGKSFRPCQPKNRGTIPAALAAGPQINLITQYVFDSEGHLRMVIPPKGVTGTWGAVPTEAQINSVLSSSTTNFNGVKASADALAPYATFNAYDYAGHLVATYSPDEGLTRFVVDQKGRVHYSQREGQRKAVTPAWTRTVYDAVFRVVAVGELPDANVPKDATTGLPSDPSIDPVSSDTALATVVAALNAHGKSLNVYDAYQDLPKKDPAVDATYKDSRLDPKLVDLLPEWSVWGAFPDAHLVQTSDQLCKLKADGTLDLDAGGNPQIDSTTVERYYYDQDGRIAIRWVTVKTAAQERNFALGVFYDFTGRVKRIVYPAGPGGEPLQVVYTYDDLGRLYAIGTPQDKAYFARYAYQPTGEVRAIVYGPGEGFAAKRMLQDPQGWLRELTVQGR